MKRILHVVGARPNFVKIAPIIREINQRNVPCKQLLIHTGQHYDKNMSDVFFMDLGLPSPDRNLEVGSASHARQTAQVMMRFEPVVDEFRPDIVVVPGDVNSTLACALVCGKLGLKVAHIEAGLRSHDRSMPEELNRVLTDHIADLLFTPSIDANENLAKEGISSTKIRFVGNVMLDTLTYLLPKIEERWLSLHNSLQVDDYILVTLHRPSNVDDPCTFHEIWLAITALSQSLPIVFPVHPRTKRQMDGLAVKRTLPNLHLVEPLGYIDFLALEQHARVVVTDSGGVQEESTFLRVPCVTIRNNTERPVTLEKGTNRLVSGRHEDIIKTVYESILQQKWFGELPELWDGHAAQRIVDVLLD